MLVPQGMSISDYCGPPEETECEICGEPFYVWTGNPLVYWDERNVCPVLDCPGIGRYTQEENLHKMMEAACRKVEARA